MTPPCTWPPSAQAEWPATRPCGSATCRWPAWPSRARGPWWGGATASTRCCSSATVPHYFPCLRHALTVACNVLYCTCRVGVAVSRQAGQEEGGGRDGGGGGGQRWLRGSTVRMRLLLVDAIPTNHATPHPSELFSRTKPLAARRLRRMAVRAVPYSACVCLTFCAIPRQAVDPPRERRHLRASRSSGSGVHLLAGRPSGHLEPDRAGRVLGHSGAVMCISDM